LKSAVTALDSDRVLCNPDWIDTAVFQDAAVDVVNVSPSEPHAANVLRIDKAIVCAARHERTAADLRARGFDVWPVEVSELAKAEAGVTCCSLIIDSL
jgi:dimethylargininase